jgi:ABC-type multidrug transport system ATPase subunit
VTALLKASTLCVDRGGREVLHSIDLQLNRGEIVALIGPNGAGKSTLLATLAGLIQPARGTVQRNGRIATVLQAPALARRTAAANVELAAKWSNRRLGRRLRHERARHALKAFRAEHLCDQLATTLSGGEARRVHLARGLVADPDVLFLDEPFAGLDPSTRADLLYDTASALRSRHRATIVVVHDRAEAWALADRVAVLIEGSLLAEGTPSEVFERPPTEEVAAFVGFVGRLQEERRVTRLRPIDVRLAGDGARSGTVERRVPVEDGVRLQLKDQEGTVIAICPAPGPEPGETIHYDLIGGLHYTIEGEEGRRQTPPGEVTALPRSR